MPSRPRSGCRSSKGSPRRRMSVWMPPVRSCPRTRFSRKGVSSMKRPARAKPAFILRMSWKSPRAKASCNLRQIKPSARSV
ncbi:hypothetical protein KMBAHK_KMBAHK_09760, partial [Dysosmobacter welbionis]